MGLIISNLVITITLGIISRRVQEECLVSWIELCVMINGVRNFLLLKLGSSLEDLVDHNPMFVMIQSLNVRGNSLSNIIKCGAQLHIFQRR